MAMPKQPQRLAAIAAGEVHYFTGKPCKHGHVAVRHVVDSSCQACRAFARDTWLREHNRLRAVERRRERLAVDPVGTRATYAKWQRERRKKFPEMFRKRESRLKKAARQRNPKRFLAGTRARQAAQIQRTPPWSDLKAIRAFYEATPSGMVVDHAIPLRGRTVSGLHVLANLQYLTQSDNLAKGNRFDDWDDDA